MFELNRCFTKYAFVSFGFSQFFFSLPCSPDKSKNWRGEEVNWLEGWNCSIEIGFANNRSILSIGKSSSTRRCFNVSFARNSCSSLLITWSDNRFPVPTILYRRHVSPCHDLSLEIAGTREERCWLALR